MRYISYDSVRLTYLNDDVFFILYPSEPHDKQLMRVAMATHTLEDAEIALLECQEYVGRLV